ncbi:MAG TPA: hypothetical protein VL359_03235, partial [bacterium]|nr:hypothetical protein [bacterium]
VCFAQALLHDPPVLILDEPTDGLDPNQKHQMRQVIRRMSASKTIILSTHILEEMEAVCSRAIIIAKGRIVVDCSPDQLAAMSALHNAVTVRAAGADTGSLAGHLRAMPGVAEVRVTEAHGVQAASYLIIPRDKQLILPQVTHLLEERRISFEEVYAERGQVDEVFRTVTLGNSPQGQEGTPGSSAQGAAP